MASQQNSMSPKQASGTYAQCVWEEQSKQNTF